MPRCASCGEDSPSGSIYCKKCGASLPIETARVKAAAPAEQKRMGLKCKMCGADLSGQFTFCISCGDAMCFDCAVKSSVMKRFSYTMTYVVVDQTITFIMNFPRCASCFQTEEQLTMSIREKLRPSHGLRWKSIDVTKAKFGEQDPEIARLQKQLLYYSCPINLLACPRCGAPSSAHQYDKLLSGIRKGKVRPRNIMVGPFGDGGKAFIDALICKKCGYEGTFISGWGLRKHLQKNGPRSLDDTMWAGASKEMLAGMRQ